MKKSFKFWILCYGLCLLGYVACTSTQHKKKSTHSYQQQQTAETLASGVQCSGMEGDLGTNRSRRVWRVSDETPVVVICGSQEQPDGVWTTFAAYQLNSERKLRRLIAADDRGPYKLIEEADRLTIEGIGTGQKRTIMCGEATCQVGAF